MTILACPRPENSWRSRGGPTVAFFHAALLDAGRYDRCRAITSPDGLRHKGRIIYAALCRLGRHVKGNATSPTRGAKYLHLAIGETRKARSPRDVQHVCLIAPDPLLRVRNQLMHHESLFSEVVFVPPHS